MVCFDRILSSEWHKVTKVIQDIGSKGKGKAKSPFLIILSVH